MKIIRLNKDGYVIRRWTPIGYQFLGRDTSTFWWDNDPDHIAECALMSKEEVIARWDLIMRDNGAYGQAMEIVNGELREKKSWWRKATK